MIEIYGAGIAGSYFANLLEQGYIDYIVYEKERKPDCRCAWGWANYSKVKELVREVGLVADDYVLNKPKRAIVNGIEFKIRDVVTFDKPQFIKDLRDGIRIEYKIQEPKSRLVVDATGNRRAIIGGEPFRLSTIQYRCKTKLDSDDIYIYARPYGYAWAFPIGEEWHIGAGGFTKEQCVFLLSKLITKYDAGSIDTRCGCSRGIIWEPEVSKYRVLEYCIMVAIGEAGGYVSGFGEGNTLAMETATCLYNAIAENTLDDPIMVAARYKELADKETEWIRVQYDFIRTLNKSWLKAIPKVRKVLKVAEFRNLNASLWSGLKLLLTLRG